MYELPLLQHCLSGDLQQDASQWRNNALPMAEWSQRLVQEHQLHPYFIIGSNSTGSTACAVSG